MLRELFQSRHNASVLAAFILFSLPSILRGQTVSGRVHDEASRGIQGVVVSLVGEDGQARAKALTNSHGQYRLIAPDTGFWRLRTARIGYRSVTSARFRIAPGELATRDLAVSVVPVALDTVRAMGRNLCRLSAADSSTVVGIAWDQVRTALAATQLSAGNGAIHTSTLMYERMVDPRNGRVGAQAIDLRNGVAAQPWRSPDEDSLHLRGFVYSLPDEGRVFEAPGLDVLVSERFLEDHCLRIDKASAKARLGIAFEPTRDRRRLPEIRGTVWLNRQTSELEELIFEYVHVPREEAQVAKGSVGFARMANGMWVISRWNIRMPTFVREPVFDKVGKVSSWRTRMDSVKSTGGELIAAQIAPSGDTLWARPLTALRGLILENRSERAVSGARITLEGANRDAVTGRDGQFRIPSMLPGRYTLAVRTPALDSLNLFESYPVLFSDSSDVPVIHVPTTGEIIQRICGASATLTSRAATQGIVVGTVSWQGGTVVPQATVRASWTTTEITTVINTLRRGVETRTDSSGKFALCGVPNNLRIILVASAEVPAGASTAPEEIAFSKAERLVRRDLTIVAGSVTTGEFAGVVTDSLENPLADVEISVEGAPGLARTDSTGRFRVLGVPPGARNVLARRLGFGPMESALHFPPGEPVERRIVLTPLNVLDPVVVKGQILDPAKRAFEDRQRLGLGSFVLRAEIEKREGSPLSSFLLQVRGAQVVSRQSGDWVFSRNQPKCIKAPCAGVYYPTAAEKSMGVPAVCFAKVILDGVLVNSGDPAPPFDLRQVPPSQVESLEFYASAASLPAEFNYLNAACGVLVIHSKRR